MLRYILILHSDTSASGCRRCCRRCCYRHRRRNRLLLLLSSLHLHGLSALQQRLRPVGVRGRRHCLAFDFATAATFHAYEAAPRATSRITSSVLLFPDADVNDVVILPQGVVLEQRCDIVHVMSLFLEQCRRRACSWSIWCGFSVTPIRRSWCKTRRERGDRGQTAENNGNWSVRARGRAAHKKSQQPTIHLPRRGATCYRAPASWCARHSSVSVVVCTADIYMTGEDRWTHTDTFHRIAWRVL